MGVGCVHHRRASDPRSGALRDLVVALGVGDEVRLVGRRSDVGRTSSARSTWRCCARGREGSPLALLEYMAGAAPIVAAAMWGASRRSSRTGSAGCWSRRQDPAALAGALRRRARRPGAGAAARARRPARASGSEYDLDVVVVAARGALRALLRARQRPNRGSVRLTIDRQEKLLLGQPPAAGAELVGARRGRAATGSRWPIASGSIRHDQAGAGVLERLAQARQIGGDDRPARTPCTRRA